MNVAARILALALALLVICVGWVASCVIWRAAEVGELVAPLETRSFPRLTVVAAPGILLESALVGTRLTVIVNSSRGSSDPTLQVSKSPAWVTVPAKVLISSMIASIGRA